MPFDRLCDVLWGDQPPANPMEQLQVLVSRLRTVLGHDGVERVDGGYRIVYDWLDVDELEQLTLDTAARMAAQNGSTFAASGSCGSAADWCTGHHSPGTTASGPTTSDFASHGSWHTHG